MKRPTALLTLFTFVVSSCGGKATPPSKPTPLSDQALQQIKELPWGLDMRVSEGKQGAPAVDHSKLAPATKLADADAEQLLARAPKIDQKADDTKAFALREKSQPPPRTGQTIKSTFPGPPVNSPPPKADATGKAPLRVLRWMPEGKVPLAPELSVTFDQPMVAVTSQEDAAQSTPVHLTPQPKGRWRWIGTRTILFDPDVRFPMATSYQVEIPAGTKSAIGNAIDKPVQFTFETPPPQLVGSYPGVYSPQHLDVPMFAMFDQRIDAQAVLSHIQVSADGKPVAIRALEPAEIAKDRQIASLVDGAKKAEQDGRWVAFRATSLLPADAQIHVEIGAGTPSAEGPIATQSPQSFDFRTYPPLRVDQSECGYGGPCRPGMQFDISFNNPLDVDAFDDAQVQVTPDIHGLKISQSGNLIVVMGLTEARTTYKVTLSKAIKDDFGQHLGTDTTLTFNVADAEPNFYGPSGLVVVDPAAKTPTLDFFTTNYDQLDVKLYEVDPSMIDAFGTYLNTQWDHDHPGKMPGKKVFDKKLGTKGGANKLVETSIDLSSALPHSGNGHVVAMITPSPWTQQGPPPQEIVWAQSTQLAVDAHVDGDHMVAFVTTLDGGKPVGGADVEIRPFGIKAHTDDRGLAELPLGTTAIKGAHFVTAKKGDDVAFVMDNNLWYDAYGSWVKNRQPNYLQWYLTDDRGMYKPGEDVSIKGWLRLLDPGKGGDLGGIDGGVSGVEYKVTDSRGNQIATGSTPVSTAGGFDLKFTLPKTPNLGYTQIYFKAKGKLQGENYHAIQVQEFRRPEFEVSASASQGPFVVGGGGDITVSAKYFSGGPLAGAQANWYVNASPTTYTPPNREDYIFGSWVPWWGYAPIDEDSQAYHPPTEMQLAGVTDASGAHVLHMDFLSARPQVPFSVMASASVMDVNRQAWSASQAIIVHPSDRYVGLKPARTFVDKGTPFDLDVVAVDIDGKATSDAQVEVKAVRVDWEFKKGKYKRVDKDAQVCDPKKCKFETPEGGEYEITATIVDAKGRPNQTKLMFWVAGGDTPPARGVSQERVQLIPNKQTYTGGETAELLVQAPFPDAEGVVTWRRSGIVKVEHITLKGASTTIKVPIADAMVPNMFVQVDLVGMAARTDDKGKPDDRLPQRPAYAVGTINLPVPPKQRTLDVKVAPNAAKLGPGEKASIGVDVRDASGKPVAGSEVALIVVDEAILALTNRTFVNPIDVFYGERGPDANDYYQRQYVTLAKPDIATLAMGEGQGGFGYGRAGFGPGGGGVEGGVEGGEVGGDINGVMGAPPPPAPPPPPDAVSLPKRAPEPEKPMAPTVEPTVAQQPATPQPNTPIALRTNFNPLAAFAPAVKTDAKGHAVVDLKMPDNLTRYRIVAIVAAGDKQFGKGESVMTARLPLMVRPSPPRFLNFGDTFRMPVVLQNQTDAPLDVRVAIRGTNASITEGAGRQVTVPANDRVEVQFPASAELAGTARFQLVATSGSYADAAELSLPVWTPATTEAFATYGVIDDGAVRQPVALPGKVWPQFGGLEVTTASTNLQALTDAMLYLVHYPYECAEQRSSRILAIAALRDVLTAFKTKDMPSKDALEASVKTDLEHLAQMQTGDGGFAFWDRYYPSEPYLTVFVASALQHAKDKGFDVPANMIERVKPYLKNIEQHYPSWYGEDIRRAISAYALYTRKQLGDADIAKGQKLLSDAGGPDKLSMEADGWLLGLFAGNKAAESERKAIVRHALNKVSETAGAANFTTSYSDGAYVLLASDRRVDAVMLESLIQEDPKLDLIPKVVTGLLAHRKAGRWLNTQENSFALLALDLYFQTYEKITPDFVARVWLGKDYAGDHAFKGRTTDYAEIDVPMKDVTTHDKQDLTIQKDGKGRLYYRVGMTYAPESLKLEPADYGFVVERRYEPVDDPKDVTKAADGVWHVKAGARVRVRLTMVNENRRYHVALVDPLPAGLEPMNPALAVTGPIPQDPKQQQSRGMYAWWYGVWFEHQNMRDERVEAFASLLWEGVHEYTYVARATTPGTFVVPPTKAEEMYMPETFGRAGTDRVVVE